MAGNCLSWGRYPRVSQQTASYNWLGEPLPDTPLSLLPQGMRRSYGDSCLNADNLVLGTVGLNRLMAFDPETGVLKCEAGTTLAQILAFCVPRGWFLPVTPGTKFVTVGGAIANDVHGKNHHVAGSFGDHVTAFQLLRSDGTALLCTPQNNPEWFAATIGGLGLTGLIQWAEIRLKPVANPFMEVHSTRFGHIDEFVELSRQASGEFEYTVAWIDCLSSGESLGRGIFSCANHAGDACSGKPVKARKERLSVPVDFPSFALNKLSVKAFNSLYYHKQRRGEVQAVVDYDPFFYPLDGVHGWNRIYGARGFLQYQCVVPLDCYDIIKEMLGEIATSGLCSFLSVLKEFGDRAPRGLLSFPREGVTLALDFPYKGKATLALLSRLDAKVTACGGAVYPAKDARMSPQAFKQYFPRWEMFSSFIDPGFSSNFWRRVTA